jgi:hypothetical protein
MLKSMGVSITVIATHDLREGSLQALCGSGTYECEGTKASRLGRVGCLDASSISVTLRQPILRLGKGRISLVWLPNHVIQYV